jgi:hypothetical protein
VLEAAQLRKQIRILKNRLQNLFRKRNPDLNLLLPDCIELLRLDMRRVVSNQTQVIEPR